MTHESKFSIALHGGAGTLLREAMSPERERIYRDALLTALRAGESVLSAGGSALDAVVESVASLERCELFNAGIGAVFTNDEQHELDATLMEGATLKAGAVCALRHIESPIKLCRLIMESEFVMLNGEGAEAFAREHGIEMVPNHFFSTEFRRNQLNEARKRGVVQLDHADRQTRKDKYGTVGAVARDVHGNLAAATSTGGMTNKKYGRIGDSALIGAGNWADNRSCAISATGHGEFFIRAAVASRIAGMIEFGKLSLQEAAHLMIAHELTQLGGDGGVVAVDASGKIAMPFNSEGMYRAWIENSGDAHTAIFKHDPIAHDVH